MSENSRPISHEKLLAKANQLIKEHQDYIAGMHVTNVIEKDGVLIFQGEYFLDDNGLPTSKSTAAFNMLKYLAHVLSDKYHIENE